RRWVSWGKWIVRVDGAASPPINLNSVDFPLAPLNVVSTSVLSFIRWKVIQTPAGQRCFLVAARLHPWIVTSEVPLLSMQRLAFGVACLAVLVLPPHPSTPQTCPQPPAKSIVTPGPASGAELGTEQLGD